MGWHFYSQNRMARRLRDRFRHQQNQKVMFLRDQMILFFLAVDSELIARI